MKLLLIHRYFIICFALLFLHGVVGSSLLAQPAKAGVKKGVQKSRTRKKVKKIVVPPMAELEKDLQNFQARNNRKKIAETMETMLLSDEKEYLHFKQLGDFYFFIEEDEKALNTYRRAAEWAKTAKVWETYSDLLLWKEKRIPGRRALENALSLDPKSQPLMEKLAGVYEYHGDIASADKLFKFLYQINDNNREWGVKLAKFFLRNGKVKEAKELFDDLKKRFGDLGSDELNLLFVKVLVWNNESGRASKELKKIEGDLIPDKDLDYFFTLALTTGDLNYAETLLKRLEEGGSDIYERKLKLLITRGDPSIVRELVLNRIETDGESEELLQQLYQTYYSERDRPNEIEVLEKLVLIDYNNPKWVQLLVRYYISTQNYQRGIDLFNQIIGQSDDADLVQLNLAKLYLLQRDIENYEATLTGYTTFLYPLQLAALKVDYAEYMADLQGLHDAIEKYLNLLEKSEVKRAKKSKVITYEQKEYTPETVDLQEVKEEPELIDMWLNLINIAEKLQLSKKMWVHGSKFYKALNVYYKSNPTLERWKRVIIYGAKYASVEQQEKDLLFGIETFKDPFFNLHYYRFLNRQGKRDEAANFLPKVFETATEIGDKKQTAEHTFGFISNAESKKMFVELIKEDPKYAIGYKRLGQISLYTKNYEESIDYSEKYLALNPNDTETRFVVGEAYNILKQYQKAMDSFRWIATQLEGKNRDEGDNERLALSYIRLKDYQNAMRIINETLKKNPDMLSLLINKLEAFARLGQWQDLLDLIITEDLERLDPMWVGLNRFMAYKGLNRHEEARKKLEDIYKVYANNKDMIATYTYYEVEQGNDIEAIKLFEAGMAIPPIWEEINRDYRYISKSYKNRVGLDLKSAQAGDSMETTTGLYSHYMLTETGKIGLKYENYTGTELTGLERTISKDTIDLNYQDNLSNRQRYEVHLLSHEKTGFKFFFSNSTPTVFTSATYFNDTPANESVALALSQASTTGFKLESVFQVPFLRQYYSLSYQSQNYDFIETAGPVKLSDVATVMGANQLFLSYPNTLQFSIIRQLKHLLGDESNLVKKKEENDLKVYFERSWGEFLKTWTEVLYGKETFDNKTIFSWQLNMDYTQDNWLVDIGLYYIQEDIPATDATATTAATAELRNNSYTAILTAEFQF